MTPERREQAVDAGLLVLRVGLGLMMATHGYPKLVGGPPLWEKLGHAMEVFGIGFAPTFWGFAAAATELFGGIALALGALTRVQAGLLAFTMLVAAAKHLADGDGLRGASHAIEDGVAFVALLSTGGGRFSIDAWLRERSPRS